MRKKPRVEEREDEFTERVVHINRCAKVVKGGRRFSFSALVVVGDGKGSVGYGFGKANEISEAIRKGCEAARRNMVKVPLAGSTISSSVMGHYGAAKIVLKPASEGTGIIAGSAARSVLELVGVRDILSKSLGSNNPINVVKATLNGLMDLKQGKEMLKLRRQQEDGVEAGAVAEER